MKKYNELIQIIHEEMLYMEKQIKYILNKIEESNEICDIRLPIIEEKNEINEKSNLNEYEKIIFKNLDSRISILEEETEKYNKK